MKNKIINNLQNDIIKIDGKKIFINPFLYSSRFDNNTYIWLSTSGQISNSKIIINRNRFYPELNWEKLTENQRMLKDDTIEMFLKTLDLILFFHPDLNKEQLLQVEKKILLTKKVAFEKWVKKSFKSKERLLLKEKRKYQIHNLFNNWKEWFFAKETQQVILPIFVIMFITFIFGWFAGISKNSCNPYFEPPIKNKV